MKRAILVHGWDGTPDNWWFPWLQKKLEKIGFKVDAPAMPGNPPIMEKWVNHLQKVCLSPDNETYFVGHSAGCQTILRYLERLPKNSKVGGVVLVAGWVDSLGLRELDNFFDSPNDWDKIKSHCNRFLAIHSDNDEWVKTYHGDEFKEKLGAKLVIIKGRGHFDQDSNGELPEVFSTIEAWSRK